MPVVFVQGKSSVSLTDADFKASGGQGTVYVKAGLAYKIYHSPKDMLPLAKIQELGSLKGLADIIRPLDVLLDKVNTPIGYTMRDVAAPYTLCQVFPKSFRDREGFTPDKALSVVRLMQTTIAAVHNGRCLIVDLNEMNFMLSADFRHVYFLDVDSYQTPHFRATALMESVRDRHCHGKFSAGTDWFAFAITSFQTLVGIHPYKGKCDSLRSLDERMEANVSVLQKTKVRVPAVTLDWERVVPSVYLKWYAAVFDRGERIAPPTSLTEVLILPITRTVTRTVSTQFKIELLYKLGGEIRQHRRDYTLTTTGVYLRDRKLRDAPDGSRLAFTPKTATPLLVSRANGAIYLRDLKRNEELRLVQGTAFTTVEDRLYVLNGAHLFQIDFLETSTQIVPMPKVVANVLPQSTQVFDGCVFQNMLGVFYVHLMPDAKSAHQVRLPFLTGYTLVNARYENGVLFIAAAKGGTYDHFILRFADDFLSHDVRHVTDCDTADLNVTVLDNRLVLQMDDADVLHLFSGKKDSANHAEKTDAALKNDATLFHTGTQALFARDGSMFTVSMSP